MRAVFLILLATALLLPAAEPAPAVETFVANVVAMSAPEGMATDTLTLRVERWTQPEEVGVLYNLLGNKGMAAFQKALNELDLGSLSSTASLGWPINLATSEKTAEGRAIRLVLERPSLGRELAKLERSADFPFVVVEFTLDGKNKGAGRVVPAAKLRLDPRGELEIVPYSEPGEQKIIGVKNIQP